jgi:uncharacterized protein (DUF427 family)
MPTTEAERVAQLIASGYGVRVEPCPRRLRVVFAGEVIADTTRALYLFETRHAPVYYFPLDDLRSDLLEPTTHTTRCPFKGDAVYWSIVTDGRRSENALWGYPAPIESCPDIARYAAFFWDRVDAWFEEDEEVFVGPRDPYHRVDVLDSSRHVEVYVAGQRVADSRRPKVLFETNLPARYYLPKLDVDLGLLQPSATRTACPYKGEAAHWSMSTGDREIADVAWTYAHPIGGMEKIANLVCFYDDKVDRVVVDGQDQPRPKARPDRRSDR